MLDAHGLEAPEISEIASEEGGETSCNYETQQRSDPARQSIRADEGPGATIN